MSAEWQRMTIANCMDAIIDYRGKTPRKTASGIPLITAKIIKNGRIEEPQEFISQDEYDDWMRRGLPKPGDIVLTTEAPLGEVAQLDERKIALAQRVITLRGKKGVLDNSFLKYALQSAEVQDELKGRASGSTVLGIKQSELRKVQIPVPPLEEQKKIGRILCALDDKIELNRRMNRTLEAIARALFKSWFVDFDPVRAKAEGRDTGLPKQIADLFPNSFVDSGLGTIPDGWKVQQADSIARIGIGKTPPRKEAEWFRDCLPGTPWVSIRDMGKGNVFMRETNEFLTQEAIRKFNIRLVPSHTVLLSFKLTVGRVALSACDLVTNEAIAHLSLDEDSPVSSSYLYFYLKTFDFNSLGSTSSIATAINSKTVRSLLVLVPDPESLSVFADIIAPLMANICSLEEQSRIIEGVRDSLLPKLMTGAYRDKSKGASA